MLLPSRTVYGTKNWPDSGWFNSGAFGLRFFCVVFKQTELNLSRFNCWCMFKVEIPFLVQINPAIYIQCTI